LKDKDMEAIKLKLMNALKGRAMKERKPMTEEEKAAMRERFVNSEFFKTLKAAQEKKINKNKEE
jgi:hypothetical protein